MKRKEKRTAPPIVRDLSPEEIEALKRNAQDLTQNFRKRYPQIKEEREQGSKRRIIPG